MAVSQLNEIRCATISRFASLANVRKFDAAIANSVAGVTPLHLAPAVSFLQTSDTTSAMPDRAADRRHRGAGALFSANEVTPVSGRLDKGASARRSRCQTRRVAAPAEPDSTLPIYAGPISISLTGAGTLLEIRCVTRGHAASTSPLMRINFSPKSLRINRRIFNQLNAPVRSGSRSAGALNSTAGALGRAPF